MAAAAEGASSQAQLPKRIRQWVTGQDGLDRLRVEEVDMPTPGEDEVLVEVRAVSLNYRDTEGVFQLVQKPERSSIDAFCSGYGPV
jgi:NADPH-dependent curcumin reductase CurA